jgi:hypothetical protein
MGGGPSCVRVSHRLADNFPPATPLGLVHRTGQCAAGRQRHGCVAARPRPPRCGRGVCASARTPLTRMRLLCSSTPPVARGAANHRSRPQPVSGQPFVPIPLPVAQTTGRDPPCAGARRPGRAPLAPPARGPAAAAAAEPPHTARPDPAHHPQQQAPEQPPPAAATAKAAAAAVVAEGGAIAPPTLSLLCFVIPPLP